MRIIMGISDWFTIFGLLFAVYALFSAEERKIIGLKLKKIDSYILLIVLFGTLLLIKYQDAYDRFTILEHFDVHWGLHSENWALILFIIAAIRYAIKLFRISHQLPSDKLIDYYKTLINQDFVVFHKLFNKYEQNAREPGYFDHYKSLIFEPAFLDGVSDQSYYYVNLLEKIDEASFKKYFNSLLNKNNSIFYRELARNNDSHLVEENNYFLYKLLHHTPGLFFKIGGLKILRDWYSRHLENEKIKRGQSIYNQSTDLIDDFELSLPLYFHIMFVKLLYEEAILQKVDTSTLSPNYTNMQSIYSNLIEKMIDNIDRKSYELHEHEEYPLKYHYLIAEIFDVVSHWIEQFNKDEYIVYRSSLFSYFPSCLRWCIAELIKGYKKGVIPENFLLRTLHHSVFSVYYIHDLKDDLMSEIENTCIIELPKDMLPDILKITLEEKFALSYRNFVTGSFFHAGSNPREIYVLERLHAFLLKNELIQTK